MDSILKVNNDYSYLITNDFTIKEKLWKHLRFRQNNYQFTKAWKSNQWDGFIDFFNKKTGRVLTGLLPEVRLVLNHFNVPFTVQDERDIAQFEVETVDENILKNALAKPVNLYDYQIDLINKAIKHKRGIIQAPTSAGKSQPLDSLVYTPSGPKSMGEINIGDDVCTPDGKVTKVIGIYPQGPKEVYEITFSNGDKVQSSKDHLWKLDCNLNKWEDKIKDTNYIIDKLKNKSRSGLAIKFASFVYFNKQKIRIHPYLLGVLIGDGALKNDVKLSNIDNDLLNKVKKIVKKGYGLYHIKNCDYAIKKNERGSRYNFYRDMIKYYGLNKLSHEKFIPNQYKYNSKIVRIKLLQGLMDTDGYIDKKGCLEYSTSSKKLAQDVKELVESLGGYCHLRTKIPNFTYKGEIKEGRLSYTVTIFFNNLDFDLFVIKRKTERLFTDHKNINTRIIESIKFIGIKHCQCILIGDSNHMYLTNHMVPTHNTFIMIGIMKALPKGTPILFLANRKSLISQNYKEIKKWGFENVGRFYSDFHEPNIITCATTQSAHHLDKLLPKFKVVIADEIHMLTNDTGISVFKKLKGASVRIAVSATPFKHGGKDNVQKYTIKGFFGPVLKTDVVESGVLTTSYLQERGNLSTSKCTFYKVDSPKIPYDIYIDAVTNGIANNFEFHKMTARLAKSLKGRTLILVERVAHGNALHKLIPNSLWVYGKDNEETREHVIKQMQVAPDNVVAIATQGIFSVGINFFVHNIINTAGGKAEHDIVQRMGRGLRTADDKTILNYYDFKFEINPYLDDHSLDRIKILKKEKHEVIIKDEIDF